MTFLSPRWPLVLALGLGSATGFAAPKGKRAQLAAARAALTRQVMLADLPISAAEHVPRLGALLRHLELTESHGARLTLSQLGRERIEVGPANGMITIADSGNHFTTSADLARHGIGTPETLAARVEERLLELVDLSTTNRSTERLALADQKLAELTHRGHAVLQHVEQHPDHLLLAKYHAMVVAARGNGPTDFPIKAEGPETLALRFRTNGEPFYAEVVAHPAAAGSRGPLGFGYLTRLQLGTPARYDAHLHQRLLAAADLSDLAPTPTNLERARNTLETRIEATRLLSNMGQPMHLGAPHLHHGIRALAETLDPPRDGKPHVRARIAWDDREAVVYVASRFSPTEGQLMVETGPEHTPTSSRPVTLADLERHGLGTLAALDAAVEAAAVARRAGASGASARAKAVAEHRAQVRFSKLELEGQLVDADLSALVREHAARDSQAGPLVLAGAGEQSLRVLPGEAAGSTVFERFATPGRDRTPVVPLRNSGVLTMRALDELIGQRLLKAAGVEGDPMNPALRANARRKLESRAAVITQAINAAAGSPDLQLLSAHRRVDLLGADWQRIGETWVQAFAVASDAHGILALEQGRLHYFSHAKLAEYAPEPDPRSGGFNIEHQTGRRSLFGAPSKDSQVGLEQLRVLGAKDETQLRSRIEQLVLERAGMGEVPRSAASLAKARKILTKQVADASALAAVLKSGHADARLLVDVARRQRGAMPHETTVVDVVSRHGKTLRVSGDHAPGTLSFLVDDAAASVASLRQLGIGSAAELDEVIAEKLLEMAAREPSAR